MFKCTEKTCLQTLTHTTYRSVRVVEVDALPGCKIETAMVGSAIEAHVTDMFGVLPHCRIPSW